MADATTATDKPAKPYWLPDTQGFLAIAIIGVVATLSFMLLTGDVKFSDKVAGAFMTLLGVLSACLKDVYSYFFGSSKGSDKKDDSLMAIASTPTPVLPPPTQAFNPVLTMKDGTSIKTIADALSFATKQQPSDQAGLEAQAAIAKTLANGGTDTEKAEAFTKWASGQGLI